MTEQREQKDNSGVMFENDRADNPKRPHFRGKAMVGGTMFRVSAWQREKNGKTYLSLAFDPDVPF